MLSRSILNRRNKIVLFQATRGATYSRQSRAILNICRILGMAWYAKSHDESVTHDSPVRNIQ